MKCVLIDTSIWVNHFRYRNDALVELLQLDMVWTHPMILGELACGTPPARTQTLAAIGLLQQTRQASVREVMAFIEYEMLYGHGCGMVDMMLLASTLLTPGVELWTLDKHLATLAKRFKIMYRPGNF